MPGHLLVALGAVIVFLPGVFGEFLNWDDDRNFTDHPHYRGFGLGQLSWMFTAFHMGHYTPLTWLSLAADYSLWGMRPRGYHVTSLLLHAATAVALMSVSSRLLRIAFGAGTAASSIQLGAAAAALIFAVHPLRAESVVWLSERRDVLSGLFYMLTVLVYLRAVEEPGAERRATRCWYLAALALFVCALLSKALVVSLPAVLIILDFYPLRRVNARTAFTTHAMRSVWLPKLPFLALATAGSVLAFMARAPLAAAPGLEQFDVVSRLITSVYGLAFYLSKTIWPVGLSPLYEMPATLPPLSGWVLASALVVASLASLSVALSRRWPAFTAAACAYVGTLLPVIGVVQSGPQITADRYTYLACLGWAVLFGSGVTWCADRWRSPDRRRAWHGAALCVATAVVLAAATLAARQSLVWQNSFELWTHALSVDPGSARAHAGLAGAYFAEGQREAADRELTRALELNPRLPEALMGLAVTRSLSGRGDEALQFAARAMRLVPRDASAYRFLGEILSQSGSPEAALAAYREAVRLDPRGPLARYAVAVKLAQLGRSEEAMVELAAAERARAGAAVFDRDRYVALVYSRVDPGRSREAWARYLASLATVADPSYAQRARVVEAVAAIAELDRAETGRDRRR